MEGKCLSPGKCFGCFNICELEGIREERIGMRLQDDFFPNEAPIKE